MNSFRRISHTKGLPQVMFLKPSRYSSQVRLKKPFPFFTVSKIAKYPEIINFVSMKRFCQTLELRDDPEMIARYVEAHAHVWPEIQAGIREVGILDMQIFRLGTRLFMIMDTVDDFDFVKDNARLATLPRQAEWEAYVAEFQGCDKNAPSTAKWQLMERIFLLDKPV